MMAELAAPLTPADCDLRGLPFMPLDVVRLLDSDIFALSTGEEFKAALALWCKAWLQVPAASLPDDDRVLAHLSGAGARWRKIREMALKGWVKCSDGRLYHPVVAEKAAEAWRHRQAQRDRANKRWSNRDGSSSGNATGHAGAHATASATAMQGTGTVKGQKKENPPNPPSIPADVRSVMEEGGFVSPPPDTSLLGDWYGLAKSMFGQTPQKTLEQDILPTVRAVRARLSKAPFKLKVFDAAIREKLAADQAQIEHLRLVAQRNGGGERTAAGASG